MADHPSAADLEARAARRWFALAIVAGLGIYAVLWIAVGAWVVPALTGAGVMLVLGAAGGLGAGGGR